MRHAKHRRRLGRHSAPRKALMNSLVRSLIIHEQIQTTQVKAKAVQPLVEKMITLGKADDLHSRRQAFDVLQDRTLVRRLFTEIAPLFKDRKGGYTRVLHLQNRKGDAAPMALFELVEKTKKFEAKPEKSEETKRRRKEVKETRHEHETSEDIATETSEHPKHQEKTPEAPKKHKNQERFERQEKSQEQKPKNQEKKSFLKNLKGFFKRKGDS